MANRKQSEVPGAQAALDSFKFEVANELGIPLNSTDNGDLTSRQAGKIGGTMVKKMIALAEQNMFK